MNDPQKATSRITRKPETIYVKLYLWNYIQKKGK